MTAEHVIPNFEPDVPPIEFGAVQTKPRRRALESLFDPVTERAILGAALLDAKAIDAGIAAGLNEATWWLPEHHATWQAIVTVHDRGDPVDPVTVHAQDQSLDAGRLVELLSGNGHLAANAATYAAELVALHRQRWSYHRLSECVNGSFALRRQIIDEVAAQEDAWNSTTQEDYFVDTAAVLAGERGPAPTVLARTCGTAAMFYRGQINSIIGPSESGKSWVAQAACVEQIKLCEHVFYEDFEKDAGEVFDRIIGMGVTEDELVEYFHYKRREDPYSTSDLAALSMAATILRPTVCVFDGVNAALMMHGLNPNASEDIARLYEGAPRRMQKVNAAAILVDHDKKDPDATTPGAGGSQHKRSGITGASYKLYLTKKFSRTQSGRGYLKVDKDAGGWVRAACPDAVSFGDIEIEVEDGSVRSIVVAEPNRTPVTKTNIGGEDVVRRTGYMAKASLVVRDAGVGGISEAKVREALKCARDKAHDALACLVDEGHVTTEGEANKRRFFHVSVFKDENVSTRSFYENED